MKKYLDKRIDDLKAMLDERYCYQLDYSTNLNCVFCRESNKGKFVYSVFYKNEKMTYDSIDDCIAKIIEILNPEKAEYITLIKKF